MIDDWLFQDQRIHPSLYSVLVQGVKERTVSIRGGIAWPGVENPGYLILTAQLEEKDKNGNLRFLAFYEDQANRMGQFMEKIASTANRWRIDSLVHGGMLPAMRKGGGIAHHVDAERSFADQLFSYLREKEKHYNIVQMPNISPSWRAKEPDFLVSLVRDRIARKTLVLFQLSEARTPLLLDRLQNADLEANILEVPELRALAHVLDDFDSSPWKPPERTKESDW
jgi:hypothetical protein